MFLKFKTAIELVKTQDRSQAMLNTVRMLLRERPELNSLEPEVKTHTQIVFVMYFTALEPFKYHSPEKAIEIAIYGCLNHDFISKQDKLRIGSNVRELYRTTKYGFDDRIEQCQKARELLGRRSDKRLIDGTTVKIIKEIGAATIELMRRNGEREKLKLSGEDNV